MKVFISWSGAQSRKIAGLLNDWLPSVIQAVKPFVSSLDIGVGDRWADALAKELDEAQFGIICVTPFNLKAPWLNFESGALSRPKDKSWVAPLLFGVEPSMVHGPLAQFQSTTFSEEGMLALLFSLNKRLSDESRLSEDLLRRTFEIWWSRLNEKLVDLFDEGTGETETGYPWLVTAGDLARREFDAKNKTVWVITPWPYKDVQLTSFVDTLLKNIGHGVTYTFIIPRDPTGQALEVLQEMFAGKILVHEVEKDRFESLAVTHYVVLNPGYDDGCCPRVFLELPITDRGYWIETSPEAAINFTNRFQLMIKPEPFLERSPVPGDLQNAGAPPS
jgi:hypothetical protein